MTFQTAMRRALAAFARRLLKNKKCPGYPQLWYYMPHRHRRRRLQKYCCVCHELIIGEPPRGENNPEWPAPLYWCAKCVYKEPHEQDKELRAVAAPEKQALSWIGCWLRPLLQWFCGWLTGHEISKTEWGYGGGGFVDRNCRWCDTVIKVPVKEEVAPPALRDLLDDGHDGIRMPAPPEI